MSTRDDIISIKNGLITLGNAIDTLSVHAEDSGQIVNSAKTINFQGKDHNSIYGKGLQWSGMGNTKMLHLQGEPNRIWSSEIFDLHKDAHYSIDNTPVLTSEELGPTIQKSNLRKVGILNGLAVNGDVNFDQFVFFDSGMSRLGVGVEAMNGQFSVASNYVEFRVQPNEDNAEVGTWTTHDLRIQTDSTDRITVKANGDVVIGNKGGTDNTVNIHGKLGVGVSNMRGDASLEVSGALRFKNRIFDVGSEAPTQGAWSQGDTIWNINPTPGNVMGWVCTKTGTPGEWKTFGNISN